MIRHCLPTCRDHLRLQHLFSTAALRAVKDLTGPSAGKTSSQEYAWRGCGVQYYIFNENTFRSLTAVTVADGGLFYLGLFDLVTHSPGTISTSSFET